MNRPFIFKSLLTIVFILMLSPLIRATEIKKENDTARYEWQDKKKDKDKSDRKGRPVNEQTPDKPDIRKVPKARKQTRPPVVIKPKIKVKPKITRPNIKRP